MSQRTSSSRQRNHNIVSRSVFGHVSAGILLTAAKNLEIINAAFFRNSACAAVLPLGGIAR
jgi:hypothetical protein